MRNAVAAKEPGREELVVGGEQRSGLVEHGDASRCEGAESPQAVVHAVERRQHVQPAERNVAGTQHVERAVGSHRLPPGVPERGGGERVVGGRGTTGDQSEPHGVRYMHSAGLFTTAVHQFVTAAVPDRPSDRPTS
jgi:hypothetical protein